MRLGRFFHQKVLQLVVFSAIMLPAWTLSDDLMWRKVEDRLMFLIDQI